MVARVCNSSALMTRWETELGDPQKPTGQLCSLEQETASQTKLKVKTLTPEAAFRLTGTYIHLPPSLPLTNREGGSLFTAHANVPGT